MSKKINVASMCHKFLSVVQFVLEPGVAGSKSAKSSPDPQSFRSFFKIAMTSLFLQNKKSWPHKEHWNLQPTSVIGCGATALPGRF